MQPTNVIEILMKLRYVLIIENKCYYAKKCVNFW